MRTVVLVLVPLVGWPCSWPWCCPAIRSAAFDRPHRSRRPPSNGWCSGPGEVSLQVRNAGPDPVTVAQVLVNDAFWAFELADPTLGRLEGGTITIPYPWEEGTPVQITLLTATGATIEHTIEAASETPPTTAVRWRAICCWAC